VGANCGLHPLIHTLLKFTLAQNVEKKEAEPRTPHILSLNQNIVAVSEWQKCGLKYVIQIASRPRQTNSKRQSHC
jgi:hypothetical protein